MHEQFTAVEHEARAGAFWFTPEEREILAEGAVFFEGPDGDYWRYDVSSDAFWFFERSTGEHWLLQDWTEGAEINPLQVKVGYITDRLRERLRAMQEEERQEEERQKRNAVWEPSA